MKLKDVEVGQIASWYTLNGWFCTVKPAYKIDKVRFDFVKKGTNGQKAFSIYVDMDRFDILCDDILSMRFKNALEEDKKNSFPQAWNYVTGEDGSKELHIGSGKNNPIVIQGRDKKIDGANGFVGIMSYDELRIMAKDFRRTSAFAFNEKSKKCVEVSEKYRNNIEEESSAPY